MPIKDLSREEKRKKKHYAKQKEKRKTERASVQRSEPTQSQDTPNSSDEQPYAVLFEQGVSRNKGIGIFATAAIPRGTLVLIERPLVLTPVDQSVEKRLKLIKKLPSHKLKQFTQLSYDSRGRSSVTLSVAYDEFLNRIWESNAFLCPRNKRAVYPHASRANHSCSPNLMLSFKSDNAEIIAHAVKNAEPGDELTWSYVDVYQPSSIRGRSLTLACPGLAKCACLTCLDNAPIEEFRKHESDRRRTRINELRIQLYYFYDCETGPKPEEANVQKCGRELVSLLKTEGLEGLLLAAVYRMMAASKSKRATKAAAYHKKKELDVMRTIFGVESPKTKICQTELAMLEAGKTIADMPSMGVMHREGNISF